VVRKFQWSTENASRRVEAIVVVVVVVVSVVSVGL